MVNRCNIVIKNRIEAKYEMFELQAGISFTTYIIQCDMVQIGQPIK